ncbi:hypothetical protein IHE56_18750 [Streptomyces sp. ID01-12c]|uniref:hypothetical protein n=1 Tax=Streptomyces caniscabiei TaxID=2746961 RepID=UPI00177FDFA5|nr:hypothetical protein [Streptomyces caniscabiei]MBD9704079.1 hypothetical protein [Streptomyces caniscabiei]MDX3733263.1 hypothetical protein [Streptomyces caniscabiei]
MSSRTRTRRAVGVHTVRVPRQRGRRSAQPFVVVVPERPSLTREVLGFIGRMLWRFRRGLAPTAAAVALFVGTGVVHLVAVWVGWVLAGAAVAPLGWLAWVSKFRPTARRSVLKWRVTVALASTTVIAWAALAVVFSPVAGPLGWLWLLLTLTAQSVWLYARRTSDAAEEIR